MVRLRLHCGNLPQGRGTFGGTLFHHRVNYFTLQNVPSISGWLSTPLLEIHSCKQLQKLLHTLSLRVFFDHDNKELKEPFSSLRGNKCSRYRKSPALCSSPQRYGAFHLSAHCFGPVSLLPLACTGCCSQQRDKVREVSILRLCWQKKTGEQRANAGLSFIRLTQIRP